LLIQKKKTINLATDDSLDQISTFDFYDTNCKQTIAGKNFASNARANIISGAAGTNLTLWTVLSNVNLGLLSITSSTPEIQNAISDIGSGLTETSPLGDPLVITLAVPVNQRLVQHVKDIAKLSNIFNVFQLKITLAISSTEIIATLSGQVGILFWLLQKLSSDNTSSPISVSGNTANFAVPTGPPSEPLYFYVSVKLERGNLVISQLYTLA
jgi:hypothetical protein